MTVYNVKQGTTYSLPFTNAVASGVSVSAGVVLLSGASAVTVSLPNADAGVVAHCYATTDEAHVVNYTDSTGSSATGTLGGAVGDGFTAVSNGDGWFLIANVNVTVS